jgi:hypothetical protein
MRHYITILFAVLIISCTGNSKTSNNNVSGDTQSKSDTAYYYWEPDVNTYTFDTIINQTSFHVITYCLNDSAVFNETFTDERSKNKNLIEFSVAHNYETDFIIKNSNNIERKLHINKENFRNKLPIDFFKICHMWKNEFFNCENGLLIFRATLAQPDTDYQIAVLYSVTDKGEYKIIKVEDESYDGSEDE